jgi:2-oxoglutarate ferredoxin oxidoreductase subunit delta
MTHEDTVKKLKSRRAREPKPVTPAPEPVAPAKDEKKSYDIDIFRAWCKSCGICAAFCPKNCLQLDDEGSPTIAAMDECTGCGWCELHCPDFAISVHPRKQPRKTSEAAD